MERMIDFLAKNNQKADFDGEDKVFVVTLENNTKAVFKKNETQDITAEIVAYKIAKHSQLAYVPPIIQKSINDNQGTLQIFEENANIINSGYELYKVNKIAFEELVIFYFISGQWDTGIHNFLLKEYQGDFYPVAIDNEVIFKKQYARYGKDIFVQNCKCVGLKNPQNYFPYDEVKKLDKESAKNLLKNVLIVIF